VEAFQVGNTGRIPIALADPQLGWSDLPRRIREIEDVNDIEAILK
jgi:hypothetical protein